MKIFEIISQFTRKISNKVLELIASPSRPPLKHCTSLPERTQIKQKAVRKRKSFHSFLKEHHEDLLSVSGRRRRKLLRNPLRCELERQFKKQPMNESNCSSNQQHMQQKNTKEVIHPAAPPVDQEPIFIDKDGLEISIIEQRDSRNDQLNNSAESDPEILKFVFGEEQPPSSKDCQRRKTAEGQEPLPRKEWWKEALDEDSYHSSSSALNDPLSSIKQGSKVDDNRSRGAGKQRRMKTKKIKHCQKPHDVRPCSLMIINVIDLAEDEDCPRLFQIPLKKSEGQHL